VRVFSGSQPADSNTYNAAKGTRERIGQMFVLNGDQSEGINPARLGEIAAIPKLKETQSGDTLCIENTPVVLPPIVWPKPVISFAVVPKTQQDEEKLTQALNRLVEEDPTLQLKRDIQTNEMLLSGMGQIHIETALDRMKRKFGVEVTLKEPKIPYMETIRATATGEGKYRKQTGGRGQFGWCWLEVSPRPKGAGVEFEDAIVGGAIPRNFIPSVEKGVKDALEKGILAGFPMTDIKVKLYDGKYHEVDSSDMAFQIAGSLGLKLACEAAGMVLLEPIMNVEVTVPDEYTGDITGDLNRRRGRLAGVERIGNMQVIKAQVPLSEMLRYAPDLDSITSGRGLFTMEFSQYEEIPPHIAEKIVAAAKKAKEEK
jgi:elongation factor G